MIKYATGRDYGKPQVLEIDLPLAPSDFTHSVDVRFRDSARNISGVVTLLGVDFYVSPGAAVLREYDAGRYRNV